MILCTKFPTPLWSANPQEILKETTLPLDEQGCLRSLETVLFPGRPLILIKEEEEAFQVQTPDYPYKGTFYVTKGFVHLSLPQDLPALPEAQWIVTQLELCKGIRYFWGGNFPSVPQMSIIHPKPEGATQEDWNLTGVDCSGLMYYASLGNTPRNTSSWLTFGQSIDIADCNLETICQKLKPLDAIVWKGHILFVFNAEWTIESRIQDGVIQESIPQRLTKIMETRRPQNSPSSEPYFVVRRWHPEFC